MLPILNLQSVAINQLGVEIVFEYIIVVAV